MYSIITFLMVLVLTYLVSFSHSHCMKGIKDKLKRMDNELYIRGASGPNRPVMISFGPLPPKPVLSTIALTDVTPQAYQSNSNNQLGDQQSSFQVTVISSTPILKSSYGGQQNLPPLFSPPASIPLPQAIPNSNTANMLTGISGSKIDKTSPGTGISGVGETDNSAGNGKTVETASSQENDKGLGHSSILTYNIGSFQGLKIVSNNKISNQNNGVNNSPGSNLDNITVNNDKSRNDSPNGIQGPDGGPFKSSQFQNNGLNQSGASKLESFVVNNNSS